MSTIYNDSHCHNSGLPAPLAYLETANAEPATGLSAIDIDRIIEMAWEDRTPFDAIQWQFGLNESEVKSFMKTHLKFNSYKLWRIRVENCKTKHAKKRLCSINRFKCSLQRSITANKISKRRTK